MQLSIPITKAKRKITVQTDDIPDAMYALVLQEGLKAVLNKGMTGEAYKTTGLEGPELEKTQEAAFKKGEENLGKLMKGELKSGRSSTTDVNGVKVPAIVLTEAKRLAKEVLKDNYRNKTGKSPSQVAAKTWTEAATKVIADDLSYIEQAKANIEARKAKAAPKVEATSEDAEALEAAAQAKAQAEAEFAEQFGIKPDEKLVKKAEADKLARKQERQLSAKQAGIVKPRKAKLQAMHIH